jgi:hypothetical protein
MDTHGVSEPAFRNAIEVLAANGVDVMISENDEFTSTPAVVTTGMGPIITLQGTLCSAAAGSGGRT